MNHHLFLIFAFLLGFCRFPVVYASSISILSVTYANKSKISYDQQTDSTDICVTPALSRSGTNICNPATSVCECFMVEGEVVGTRTATGDVYFKVAPLCYDRDTVMFGGRGQVTASAKIDGEETVVIAPGTYLLKIDLANVSCIGGQVKVFLKGWSARAGAYQGVTIALHCSQHYKNIPIEFVVKRAIKVSDVDFTVDSQEMPPCGGWQRYEATVRALEVLTKN